MDESGRISRRAIMAAGLGASITAGMAHAKVKKSRVITTEEGFSIPELLEAYDAFIAKAGSSEAGFRQMIGTGKYPRSARLLDPETRIEDMKKSGVDMQVLLVNSPGVQIFEAAQAAELARLINNRASEWKRKWPQRFAPLAAIAPQDPAGAAIELERAVKRLGLHGAIINSHTRGEYLDDRKFWPIFEAAQALDVPVYIHPREPSAGMYDVYHARGLDGAIWGYAAETGLHALRLIVSGVFDQFPQLKIVIGHDGEGIPFYLDRIDNRYRALNNGTLGQLQHAPSYYFKRNFWVTTSGANWAPAVKFCQEVLGPERVLYAIDYPFEDELATARQAAAIRLDARSRALFFHENAERLFKIAPA